MADYKDRSEEIDNFIGREIDWLERQDVFNEKIGEAIGIMKYIRANTNQSISFGDALIVAYLRSIKELSDSIVSSTSDISDSVYNLKEY